MRNPKRMALSAGLLAAALTLLPAAPAWSQTARPVPAAAPAELLEAADANQVKEELHGLLEHYPPTMRQVLAMEPSLLSNQPYLAPYPALAAFLTAHPEVVRNPAFYFGDYRHQEPRPRSEALDAWMNVMGGLAVFAGLSMAIAIIAWLIRTLVDYRRWSRQAKVQAEFHTKLLDRFAGNDELLAYIRSSAGARFLESTPISLDAPPKSLSAPLGRILWSIQGGVVLGAGGFGLIQISTRFGEEIALPLRSMGVLAVALGIGFILSAIIAYGVSYRLGLLESQSPAAASPQPPAPTL